MDPRYDVPLDDLEAQAHVAGAEQVTAPAEARLRAPLLDGPQVHPFGDGAAGGDGD